MASHTGSTPGIVDPDRSAELARQRAKSQMVTQLMGGVAPWLGGLARFKKVLDVACGPGGWGLDAASENSQRIPPLEVVGIDISDAMIKYARTLARDMHLGNARFEVKDATKPLGFADATFDLVHARFLIEVLARDDWEPFLRECMRVLRPGGILTVTEFEMGMANSNAHQHLCSLFVSAMHKAGRTFSPDGAHLGIVHELEPLLQRAGFRDTKHVAHALNYSAGSPQHEAWTRDLLILAWLSLPFLVRMGVAKEEELQAWYEQMKKEMSAPVFRGILFFLTAWGERP